MFVQTKIIRIYNMQQAPCSKHVVFPMVYNLSTYIYTYTRFHTYVYAISAMLREYCSSYGQAPWSDDVSDSNGTDSNGTYSIHTHIHIHTRQQA